MKKYAKIILISFITFTIVWINDIFIRPYSIYNKELRYIDHLLSGIAVPYLFYLGISDDIKFCSALYFFASFGWELFQFIGRGYFQWDQLFFDFIGVVISYFYMLKKSNKIVNI